MGMMLFGFLCEYPVSSTQSGARSLKNDPVAKPWGVLISVLRFEHVSFHWNSVILLVSVLKDFYAWSLEERLQFVVLADHGHVRIRALGLQLAIGLCLCVTGSPAHALFIDRGVETLKRVSDQSSGSKLTRKP